MDRIYTTGKHQLQQIKQRDNPHDLVIIIEHRDRPQTPLLHALIHVIKNFIVTSHDGVPCANILDLRTNIHDDPRGLETRFTEGELRSLIGGPAACCDCVGSGRRRQKFCIGNRTADCIRVGVLMTKN